MFRPEKIEKTTLLFPKVNKEQLFFDLHESGVCELAKGKDKQNADLAEAIELLQYIHRMQNRLKVYTKQTAPDKSLLKRKKGFQSMTTEIAKIDGETQTILEQIHVAEQTIEQCIQAIETVQLLPQDVQTIQFQSTKQTHIEIGTIPIDELARCKLPNAVLSSKKISDDQALLIVFSPSVITEKLFAHGFIRLDFEKSDLTARELANTLRTKRTQAKEQIETLKIELAKIADSMIPKLLVYEEEVGIFVNRFIGLNKATDYDSFGVVTCWVVESKKAEFQKVVKKASKDALIIAEFDHDQAPSNLKNSRFAKPFELITKLYSVPKSRGFDPTLFIAFTFPLFFGLMLTDFAYGLAMVLFASALWKKTNARDVGTKNFSMLLIISGIVTMIFGTIFGSYFGNFFQMLGFNVPYLLDSMTDIMPMIAIVLTLGMVHITLGLVVGLVEGFKEKQYVTALKEQGVWIVFVLSIMLLIAGGLFATSALTTIGLIVLGVSILMQFVLSFKKDGFISAILALFDFSGFMGDVFSYIRLMALAIGTSGIALAVNFMVMMAMDMIPYVGIVFAILIFIIGHLFNLVMNGLGGFIHTLRLHFLEHFSKYYDGGGTEYTPYFANRKYTLNEENKK